MSLSYSYGQLAAALQAWTDINSSDVVQNMPDVIQKGELRLYHALDLDNLDPIVECPGNASQSTGTITKPSNLIRERVLSLIKPGFNPSSPTVFLGHFDGTNGSTTFIDSSGLGTLTALGALGAGAAVISTASSEFGGASLAILPGSTSWNNTESPSTATCAFMPITPANNVLTGNGDFTIEGWFNISTNSVNALTVFDYGNQQYGGDNQGIYFQATPTSIHVYASSITSPVGWIDISATGLTINKGTWYHFALVRHNGTATFYLGGVQTGTPTASWATGSPTNPYGLWLGFSPLVAGGFGTGYIDEVRISNYAVYTANFTPPTQAFSVPPAGIQNAVGILRRATFDFVQQYLIDNGVSVGPPKYYAEYNQSTWQLAPIPDQLYTLNVRGIFRPTLLGDNPETTNLAGIVALQHTVSSTALTLLTSPFVYANNVPSLPSSQVWLYSSGNMSANNFTIVGLDDDGNAQQEVVAGPSGGSVQSVGYYSQINSITPSATDNSNNVSVGWSQDNQTWLSSRFGDLLFWYCMVEVCQFNKRFSAAKEAEGEIAKLLPFAQMITRSLKRNDFDDLYSGRQNAGAPGAVPLPVPPQSGVAPQQGEQ